MSSYTKKQLRWLAKNYEHMNARQLTEAFNKQFNENRTHVAIRTILNRKNIKREYPRKIQSLKLLTEEQANFLRENYPHHDRRELLKNLNERFSLNIQPNQLKAFLSNHKIHSGRSGQFNKGATPWNKGKYGYMGANRTSFKPGQEPPTAKPLWHERTGKDGYIEISVPERNPHTGCPRRFKHKHVWIWEQANGPAPDGHAIIFKDGDKRNFNIDNLELVSRNELLCMNLYRYSEYPEELKPSILAMAKLEAKAGFRISLQERWTDRKKQEAE
ncbi:MAG: HNH endonuclease signature motif containing protein [Desulfosalsimonas sp.]